MNTATPVEEKTLTGDGLLLSRVCNEVIDRLNNTTMTDQITIDQLEAKILKFGKIAAYADVVINLKKQLPPILEKHDAEMEELKEVDKFFTNNMHGIGTTDVELEQNIVNLEESYSKLESDYKILDEKHSKLFQDHKINEEKLKKLEKK